MANDSREGGKGAVGLLVCALASIGLIAASLFSIDWFVMHVSGMDMPDPGSFGIDLRSAHVCTVEKVCTSVPLSAFRGAYPTAALVTFWSSVGFAALVALQAGRRALVGTASDSASKFGYLYALYGMCVAFATGYLFAPEGTAAMADMTISIGRTWAPVMLLGGFALGFAALHLAIAEDDGVGSFKLTVIGRQRAQGVVYLLIVFYLQHSGRSWSLPVYEHVPRLIGYAL